jgi:antitoxin VapB
MNIAIDSESRRQAVVAKEARIRAMMAAKGMDALVLHRVSSFAWATDGGASYINTAASNGTSQLLYTPDARHLITNNIELPRLLAEEGLADQGWEIHAPDWHAQPQIIEELSEGCTLGSDGLYQASKNLAGSLAHLRAELTPAEQDRFRQLGQWCAEAMNAAIHQVQPGMSEFEIAAILGKETQQRGVQPIVNLIATDENIVNYRHPLPTDRKMERYAMLVLCGRKWGLVASITRLVHLGDLPGELAEKMNACAQVDGAVIQATRPSANLYQVFSQIRGAYKERGFPDEWRHHHQGGPAGYEPREVIATPGVQWEVLPGQAYAWNPSIAGVKSEDTILVGEEGNEVITQIPGWPLIETDSGVPRPAILCVR